MPLVIYRFKDILSDGGLQQLADQAIKGFEVGCLICDSRLDIIAFDDRGRLVYASDNEMLKRGASGNERL